MHALSLCRSLFEIVTRAAAGREVETVHLRVGQLRQVIPATLEYCWEMTCAHGPLAGSRLAVESVPVRLECHDCHATTLIEHALVLVCGQCGSGRVRPIEGEEFIVTTIDVRTQECADEAADREHKVSGASAGMAQTAQDGDN